MKVGNIRCQLTEDMCPGCTDFKVAKEGTLGFEVSVFSRAVAVPARKLWQAKLMVERGAEAIVFASCMKNGNPIGYPRPHFAPIKGAVEKRLGADAKIIDWRQ